MKKTLIVLCCAVMIFSIAACKGGGKYADVKSVMEKYIAATEKFAGAMEKVDSADKAAAAINSYAAVAKVIAPQIKAMEGKYPEFKDMDNPPAELKPIVDKAQAVATKMMAAMGKIAAYASDPKVQEAQSKLQEAMAAMR